MTDQEKIVLIWQTIDELNTLANDHRDDRHNPYVYRKTMEVLHQIASPEIEQQDDQE